MAIFLVTESSSESWSSGISWSFAPWCLGIISYVFSVSKSFGELKRFDERAACTECPRERGPMSRNANVFSDSKIFIEGISPGVC
jgi:hypothetical protein